jgi:hypothetical protein
MKTRRVKEYEPTLAGLIQWYKSAFERLGWMVLAKKHGMKDKVSCYVKELQRLHHSLDQKIKKVFDEDRRQDLTIMKSNVEILLEHAKKDFKST